MFTTSHSLCTNCQGHIHGPDHAVGTNLCCLAGFSPDPIRDIPPHQTFSPSKQMLAVSANGSILRGARSMHVPYQPDYNFKRPKFNTKPYPTPSKDSYPEYTDPDPFYIKPIVPNKPLPLNGDATLRTKIHNTCSKSLRKPQFDESLPPEERLALRRFMTEKVAHVIDRSEQSQTSGQWWENDDGDGETETDDSASTTEEEDTDEETDEDPRQKMHETPIAKTNRPTVSWVRRGKKMHKIEADRVTLSPRERFLGQNHNSGGGVCLSAAHRWLRKSSSTILVLDAGKTGFRSVNGLEYCLRKYEHALRCKSYSEAAKHWHDEYEYLTKKSTWKFYNDHLYRRIVDAHRHAKEVGLENALRGGGYALGTGLDSGEQALIQSGFSATVIHDLVWEGDVVQNMVCKEPEEEYHPDPLSTFNRGTSPSRSSPLPPLSVQVPRLPHAFPSPQSPLSPCTVILPASPASLQRRGSLQSILIKDPNLTALEHQRNIVSDARSEYWTMYDVLARQSSEAKMVVGALHQAYAYTEFLVVLEKRAEIVSRYLSNQKVEKGTRDSLTGVESTPPNIEPLGGVEHFHGSDLLACQRLSTIPSWATDLFLGVGLMIGTFDSSNPLLPPPAATLSKQKRKRQEQLRSRLAHSILVDVFGTPVKTNVGNNRCRAFFKLYSKKQKKLRATAIKKAKTQIINHVHGQLSSVSLHSFDRKDPHLISHLLASHLNKCHGQPSLNRWQMPEQRSPLDRVVEGLFTWLNVVSAYLNAAHPFWSTLNSIKPLSIRMDKLTTNIENNSKHLEKLSSIVDIELEALRTKSTVLADAHAERHNQQGSALKWRRKLPGTKGSHEHYPELMVRDGLYRFNLPGEFGGTFRDDLHRRMNQFYKEQNEPWFKHRHNLAHPDHPEKMFAHEKITQEQALEAIKLKAIKRERKITKRLIEQSTDEHLDLMLTGGADGEHLKQHVHHHRRKLHHEDIHGKTIWNWTWTQRLTPFAGHTRTEMLSSCGLPVLPLLPQAPN